MRKRAAFGSPFLLGSCLAMEGSEWCPGRSRNGTGLAVRATLMGVECAGIALG